MAKLSVYNTIDRSQLGGKFVPLIQSGVSNYKILASDLGKEYHPGDAIEITDTGEINVKFHPYDFGVYEEGLTIKTDADRGVFKGSDGIYIASADSTINVSVSGIKVNRSNLVSRISGAGLKAVGEMIDVNSADDTIDVGMDGIRVNTSALSIPNAHSLAGIGLDAVDGNTLYVKSANGTINVSSLGIKVNTSFLAGRYLRSDSNHGITVDTAPLAHAITGSGLVETNGLIGVNVNTSTGIIVNDNRLYLNAGYGLHTTNNTVKVKAANNSIGVSSAGIKVDTYYLAGHGLSSYYGTLLCVHSADKFIKVAPTGVGLHYQNLISSLTNEYGGSANIKIEGSYLYTAIGDGLCSGSNKAIYVKSADDTINVNGGGISVNPGYSLSSTSVGLEVNPSNDTLIVDSGGVSVNTSYLAGYGLSSVSNSLEVKPADNTITVGPDGIKVNKSALSIPTALSLAGNGLGYYDNNTKLYIRSSNNTISVSDWGISVYYGSGLTTDSVSGALIPDAGYGLETNTYGLSAKSANNSIGVSEAGITVNAHSLAGYGLSAFSNGIVLHVQPADNTITVGPDGIKVNKSALSIPTASSLVGSGLTSRGSCLYVQSADSSIGVGVDGIKVNAASGLETTPNGLYVKSADDTIYVNSAGIKVNTLALAGGGLAEHVDGGSLQVLPSDSTISVSSSGVSVNYGLSLTKDASGRLISALYAGSGVKLKYNYISLHTGDGLEINDNGAVYVKSADSSIGVGVDGIKVNAGYGLETTSSGLYVKSAGGTIGVTSSGIGVNVQSGGGILTGINGLYIDSAQLAGSGLGYKGDADKVKLYVISADSTIDVSSAGIKVNTLEPFAGLGLEWSGAQALYVKSADNTISVSEAGIKVNTSALPTSTAESFAGHGLTANPYSGKLDIYCGSGLDIDKSLGKVIVKSANNSIDVSDNGIKVRTYADQGVFVGRHGVYLNSADSSIGLSAAGIKVNTHSVGGIGVTDKHGLYIKLHTEGCLKITEQHGLSVKLASHSGLALGEHGLYLASGSHGVSSDAICIPYGGPSVSNAYAIGAHSIAIGYSAHASHPGSTVIGTYARGIFDNTTVVGFMASAHGHYSTAVGHSSIVLDSYSSAFGSHSYVNAKYCLSAGFGSVSTGDRSVSLGFAAAAQAASSIAIGSESNAGSAYAVAIGPLSSVGTVGNYSVSIGYKAYAGSGASIAIGSASKAYHEAGISIGNGSVSSMSDSIAIGRTSYAYSASAIAIGRGSDSLGYTSIAIGLDSMSSRSYAVAIGAATYAEYYGIAIGYGASAVDGSICFRTADSDGNFFSYKYDYNGKLYATDTSGGTYTRSWENLLTPPDPSTKTTINSETTYTADKPLWIGGSGYSGGGLLLAEFYINGVFVGCASASNNNSDAFIVPVAKGNTYKINLKHNGGNTPTFFRMYCQ